MHIQYLAPHGRHLGVVDAREDLFEIGRHDDKPLYALLQVHQGSPDDVQKGIVALDLRGRSNSKE